MKGSVELIIYKETLMYTRECKICKDTTTKIWDKQFDINYFYCSGCQFIFMEEDKIISPKEEVAIYKQHNNTLENEGYVNMFKDFIRENIQPYPVDIKKALDFGSGPGPVLAQLLREEGFEVDIYDPYFSPLKVYEGKEYQLITSTEVFEHLKNPLETAALLKRHMSDKGLLVVMTQFHPGPEEFKDWWYRRDPTHISFFVPQTFKVIAEILNMKVLRFDDKKSIVLRKN